MATRTLLYMPRMVTVALSLMGESGEKTSRPVISLLFLRKIRIVARLESV
ncbi:hypothetical protein SI65_01356 [Aspergillus cristatus]|uniref:Uncharacterized protein n=1 Tax=Aspergillus cristatus TaxID=573508 RepID=A0A1E3BSA7_ASPCR|nr:hypothetical protein SI65_01356 [Aspergillus cristatus]